MTTIQMRRRGYNPEGDCEHAGLFLQRGFKEGHASAAEGSNGESGEHNKKIVAHHQDATKIQSGIYSNAYDRWKAHLVSQGNTCGHWFGELVGRMYLGLGEASPLEAGITLHHTYGVPFIPGTAVKGALHHFAMAHGVEKKNLDIIFGREPDPGKEDDQGDAGYVIFNDAWWIPSGNALVPEVVTVHHQDYYSSGGENPATDFDDPNPNSQMAITGSFHFSYFADEVLHAVVGKLFEEALQQWGVGGKTSSGYGYFRENTQVRNVFKDMAGQAEAQRAEEAAMTQMSPVQKEIYEIEKNSKSAVTDLLQALENNRWPDTDDQNTVAIRIRELMKSNKRWNPNYDGKNTGKRNQRDRAQRVMKFLKCESG